MVSTFLIPAQTSHGPLISGRPAVGASDGIINRSQYQGFSAASTGPVTLEIIFEQIGCYFESELTISATPTTGIVAVDDGEPWLGVSNLLLPFPPPLIP